MLEDTTLLDRCRRGDDLAWEALVRRYQRRVFAVAYHYMRNREEARDMAQEVFVKIYQQLGRYEVGKKFLPWMLSVARNACIDQLRKRKARPPLQDVSIDDRPHLATGGPTPEEEMEEDSRRRLLYRALARMSDANREIILLKEIQGMRLEEISRLLALPLGTIKSRSSRARVELATKLRVLDPSYGIG